MLARGGGDTYGHEGTLNLYAALAQIGLPALLVDHRAKNAENAGPWGSVINYNSLRLAFSVTTMASADGIDIQLKRIKMMNLSVDSMAFRLGLSFLVSQCSRWFRILPKLPFTV
jgi:hypothetical protein